MSDEGANREYLRPHGSVSERVLSIVFAFDDEGRKEAIRSLARRVHNMEEFLRSCRDGFDCDTGANGSHPHYCRKCEAERLLKWNRHTWPDRWTPGASIQATAMQGRTSIIRTTQRRAVSAVRVDPLVMSWRQGE